MGMPCPSLVLMCQLVHRTNCNYVHVCVALHVIMVIIIIIIIILLLYYFIKLILNVNIKL